MNSLFVICHLFFISGTAPSLIRQYMYVPTKMNWITAQKYCRQMYGDLATITTEEEYNKVVTVAGDSFWAWIGMNRSAPELNVWQWSDGEKTNFTKWHFNEPNNETIPGENCVVMNPYGWYDDACQLRHSSICSKNFMLVKEKKTWEEAHQHCRTYYSNFSQIELGLFKTDTEEAQTASVWTGLRFLDGKWFWVNGVQLDSLASLPTCPIQPYRCGAYNFNTYVWENRDCNEELNFLCDD
ncbi:macrophage mannose receptor 1-like [Tachysurus ichikawai]